MRRTKITVVGLGYVGLPLASAFSRQYEVHGYDISEERISELKRGHDRNGEITDLSRIHFSTKITECQADIYIIAVPTPVKSKSNIPDLELLKAASMAVGRMLKKNDIVVYESTVYPGTVDGYCIPILEKESRMCSPDDFAVGYSPERINPGDHLHTLERIHKLVSGQTTEWAQLIGKLYRSILCDAHVYSCSSIKTAEMAKLIENCQRDVNIAFMNEVSALCNKLKISTCEVLNAAKTKWNFIPFEPGPVGGHCIPVDPHYFTHLASILGVDSKVVRAARETNANVPNYVVSNVLYAFWRNRIDIHDSTVLVMGLTFKANCKDTRNSPSYEIIDDLTSAGVKVVPYDPVIDVSTSCDLSMLGKFDAIIVAVRHDMFLNIPASSFIAMSKGKPLVFDLKSIYHRLAFEDAGIELWQM